uniref:(northern house mosquito) hypothetical protein n=1 Tax=Culex pipiens TaxID=7175 RepID=A0A8D8ACJ9_CULPI
MPVIKSVFKFTPSAAIFFAELVPASYAGRENFFFVCPKRKLCNRTSLRRPGHRKAHPIWHPARDHPIRTVDRVATCRCKVPLPRSTVANLRTPTDHPST